MRGVGKAFQNAAESHRTARREVFACRQSLIMVTRSALKELCGRFERGHADQWLCHHCAEAGPSSSGF